MKTIPIKFISINQKVVDSPQLRREDVNKISDNKETEGGALIL